MFKLIRYENASINVPEPVYHQADGTIVIGEALVLNAGKLTKCGATTKPTHIAMGDSIDGKVAACLVNPNMVFEVPVTEAPTSLVVGNKVTLSTDGLGVTATTTSGVVTIESLNGATKANDTIVVRIM